LHHSPTRNMHRSHIDPLPLLADRTLPQLQCDGHLLLACGAPSVLMVGWFSLHHFNLTPDGRPWWGPTDSSLALESDESVVIPLRMTHSHWTTACGCANIALPITATVFVIRVT